MGNERTFRRRVAGTNKCKLPTFKDPLEAVRFQRMVTLVQQAMRALEWRRKPRNIADAR